MNEKAKTAIIIGAGPAGLTAAYELLQKTDIVPFVFEASGDIGGISKTINYKGNRIDLGGHRFFSKSERVMKWWQNILPLQGAPSKDDLLLDRNIPLSKETNAPNPQKQDEVMLVRSRLSRIFFLRRFFDYPISLNLKTLQNLGIFRIIRIAWSYLTIRLFPIKKEKNLEDFFTNRFGKELYLTFFKDYTEKVWGVPCSNIKPEWGAQRIKGLSITKAIIHALKNIFSKDESLDQKKTQTSLIEQFLYPKYGPGQLWEKVAELISEKGGEVNLNQKVIGIEIDENRITGVTIRNEKTGNEFKMKGDYFFSCMPVKELIEEMDKNVPKEVRKISEGLIYRDFVTVGLLLKKMKIKNETKLKTMNNIVPDNWIYIQERDVKVGRLQIFNNWSPYMVKDDSNVWIGLEYFCNEGDELWSMADKDLAEFAIDEFCKIDLIEKEDVLDSVVIRMPKTYPAYFGSYDKFYKIREFTDKFENLFLIGRNGMHRYNNQDHSMLTAMMAVENIVNNIKTKDNIWEVNTEKDYHEEK
ncbi:MAG: NAD(P)/FAD-dependent oxidoreductase [Candidatus Cloacimonetes bacterium]|nr:NAD(P)/FAD-dependent oxidoreductase [Candidatus Cloacimonadota bacterium]MBL7148637.1 NAD(P)/FAD-dependent oxidoreductase [Candidatus Cloacimonadota bacterium]